MQSSPDNQMITDAIEVENILSLLPYKEELKDAFANGSTSEFPGTSSVASENSARRSPMSNDEFWDALSSHYDYLMDDGLIATCREASSDLSWDDEEMVTESYHWSFTQFTEHFKQLHDRLHKLQEAQKKDNFKEGLIEEQKKISYLCRNFNLQGEKLSIKYPDMRDEVHRYLNLLTNKVNAVEQSTIPPLLQPVEDSALKEISALIRWIRRSLNELEGRLCSLPLLSKISLEKLELMLKEQMELQKDIKDKGRYIPILLKLCECRTSCEAPAQASHARWDAARYLRVGKNLQQKWLSLLLQSIECHCSIDNLIKSKTEAADETLDQSLTEEPLKKYPRLDEIGSSNSNFRRTTPMSDNDDHCTSAEEPLKKSIDSHPVNCRSITALLSPSRECKVHTNDKGVMVGNTGITELKAGCRGTIGKFEIVQDVGYSSETSAHFSNDEQGDTSEITIKEVPGSPKHSETPMFARAVQSTPPSNATISSQNASKSGSARRLIHPPDKYSSSNLKKYLSLTETSSPDTPKSVPHSFYKMTSLESEAAEEVAQDAPIKNVFIHSHMSPKPSEYTNTHQVAPSTLTGCKSRNVQDCVSYAKIRTPPKSPNKSSQESAFMHGEVHDDQSHRTDRVVEWLYSNEETSGNEQSWSRRHYVNNSCDASAECTTTTESDGEKSCNSDDVNNSVALSQSFTGSVETVVKAVKEEMKSHSDRAGSADPSPCVRMRKKKRHNRNRPWSVTELSQVPTQLQRFCHSTSEGALDAMFHSHGNSNKTSGSKKLLLGRKKSSLTDMSVNSCPVVKSKAPTSQSGSYSSTPQSDGCASTKDCISSCAIGGRNVQNSSSSDTPSGSSLNSTSSRSRRRSKRRIKSSHSECSSKKSNSDGSSIEKTKSKAAIEEKSKSATVSKNLKTEDHSSMSDQYWDEYQDPPYLSEPYSEQTADEDQVRKLINFGDDYRVALGCQSDSSARSTCKGSSKSRSRCMPQSVKNSSCQRRDKHNSASDSDAEDFHNILATSRHALHFVQNRMKEDSALKNLALSSEFSELVATCQTNLCHLHAIQEELTAESNGSTFSPSDLKKLQDLIREWEVLQAKLGRLSQPDDEQLSADLIQTSIMDIESTMAVEKGKLNAIWTCAFDALEDLTSLKQLKENIQDLQYGLANLHEMKGAVFSLSARIRRLMAESGSEAVFPLRDAAAKLYQQWEDVYELSKSQLTKLQRFEQNWQGSKENLIHQDKEQDVLKTDETQMTTTKSIYCAEKDVRSDGLQDADQELQKLLPLFNLANGDYVDKNDEVPHSFASQKSRLWRALRAAMPIHLALVISYCISCLMEPECCENINSLDFSVFPQLRHFNGPPPI